MDNLALIADSKHKMDTLLCTANQFFEINSLSCNKEKTHIINNIKKRKSEDESINFDGHTIPILKPQESVKYLGLLISLVKSLRNNRKEFI
jgi:hypothetical protein